MARPRKTGLDYFPLDCSFFSDRKIKVLKSRFGADGITFYLYILCETYKEGYYLKLDKDFEFLASDDLNMSPGEVKQMLAFLIGRSLLVRKLISPDTTTILTSEGIQKRFQEAISVRASKNSYEVDGRIWLLKNEDTKPYIKVTQFSNNSKKNHNFSRKNSDNSEKNDTKKSKENKSKENKSVKYREKPSPTVHTLEEVLNDFIEFRKMKGKPLYGQGVELIKKNLEEMAPGDEEKQIKILLRSIKNGWTSVHPYSDDTKSSKGNSPSSPPKTRFHNFEQRDTDYDALLHQINTRR